MTIEDSKRAASAVSGAAPPVVDSDVHPVLGSTEQLLPYVDEYWHESLTLAGFPQFVSDAHPPGAPISERPDARRDAEGRVAHEASTLVADVLDGTATDIAILQCLYGVQHAFNPQMERMLARAVNQWIADEWLAADPRLRASIVVPLRGPDAAVAEIEHWAGDPRFVQVLLPLQSEVAYGREVHWPIWEAAERHGLPVALHLGGPRGAAPTSVGWPSSFTEYYAGQTGVAEGQLASIISGGVLQHYPKTRIVLAEVGFHWLPAFMWRFSKLWKGLRRDVPWVDRLPSELIREHVRVTTSPDDGASRPGALDTIVERLGSDRMLLFASDYPHWHATDASDLERGTSDAGLIERIRRENPEETYGAALRRPSTSATEAIA